MTNNRKLVFNCRIEYVFNTLILPIEMIDFWMGRLNPI